VPIGGRGKAGGIAVVDSPEQAAANAHAVEWEPSPEDLVELDGISPSSRPAGE